MKGYTASVILQPQNATRSGPILSVNPCVLKGPFWALFGDVSTLDTNFGTLWDGASALLLQLLPSLAKKKVSITKQCWHAPLCYTSLIIYFKSNSRTTSRTCTVPSISSNSTWVYIQYTCLSICMIHHDSACLNEDLLGSHSPDRAIEPQVRCSAHLDGPE